MLSKAIRDLSIRDLLHALNEKLGLECTQIRDIAPSHVVPAASLESKVSTRQPILVPSGATMGSDSSGPYYRSIASKPEHTMF